MRLAPRVRPAKARLGSGGSYLLWPSLRTLLEEGYLRPAPTQRPYVCTAKTGEPWPCRDHFTLTARLVWTNHPARETRLGCNSQCPHAWFLNALAVGAVLWRSWRRQPWAESRTSSFHRTAVCSSLARGRTMTLCAGTSDERRR